ncbi:MAG: hypothetical protein WC222_05825 [Parachlamydiales bacterium]|jgi:hypothetical protein
MDRNHPPGENISQHTHRPEFILLEDTHKERPHAESNPYSREENPLPPLEDVIKTDFPFTLRVMSLGFSIMMFFAAIGALIGTIFCFLINLITLGYSKTANDWVAKCFYWWKKLFVLSLGFFIAVFSPSLGLTIIVVFFILQGEKLSSGIFSKILRPE